MERIAVVGNSGSGKSTFARALAEAMDLPRLELDSVFHLPGWAERDLDDFRAVVADFIAADRWVVDGNYHRRVGDLVWARADTVVWLDLPRRVVMRQVIRRTVVRAVTREELWNGNRERWSDLVRWDPERSIVRWAWKQHTPYRRRYEHAMTDRTYSTATVVRVRSHQQAAVWLREASVRGARRG